MFDITCRMAVFSQFCMQNTGSLFFLLFSTKWVWTQQNLQNYVHPAKTDHLHIWIRIFIGYSMGRQGCSILHAGSKDSDQTAWMCRLSLCWMHMLFILPCSGSSVLIIKFKKKEKKEKKLGSKYDLPDPPPPPPRNLKCKQIYWSK